jgi:hypothetical protein
MAALTINAANVRASPAAAQNPGTAGQDILAGRPVYLNSTTQTYFYANALISNAPAGVAVCSANTNQQFFYISRDPNFAPGFAINAGNMAIVGNVAGQINDVADRATGWYVHFLGIGIGGNNVNFSIVGANVAM